MEFWEIAFDGVGVGELKEMLEQWVTRARTRMNSDESVPCLCVFKEEGVYKMKDRLVTVELLDETEKYLRSEAGADPPDQLVFLGQNVKLLSTIFKADLVAVHIQDTLKSVVLDVSKRIETDDCDYEDLTWFIQAGDDNLYVATRYRDMFACACSEPAWKVTGRGQMVKQEYADWIESHIGFVKGVKFMVGDTQERCLLTSSAREHESVTVHVNTDFDVCIQASMSELYFLGTRYIITRKYKSLQANKRLRDDPAPEPDIIIMNEAKRPRVDTAPEPDIIMNDEIIAATKVLLAVARKRTAADSSDSVIVGRLSSELEDCKGKLLEVTQDRDLLKEKLSSELETCKKRLLEVTQDRDRIKGIFAKLQTFSERKNKI